MEHEEGAPVDEDWQCDRLKPSIVFEGFLLVQSPGATQSVSPGRPSQQGLMEFPEYRSPESQPMLDRFPIHAQNARRLPMIDLGNETAEHGLIHARFVQPVIEPERL